MSVGIYIREITGELYIDSFEPLTMCEFIAEPKRWPNLVAAQEEFARHGEKFGGGFRLEAVAADPDDRAAEPVKLCEMEAFAEIEQTPLRGAVELFAMLRKSSKYHGQFPGWAKVDAVLAPSQGDQYCFRCAHNAYRHEDLTFAVKLPKTGEMMRLDKWVAPKAGKAVAA